LASAAAPAEVARDILATIGLTPRQAAAVANFRRLLESGDKAALSRALRDQRFDATIQRLVNGEAVDQAKIDRMVQRYAERYQAYRANVIARYETMEAANAGRRAAWRQFAGRRGIPLAALKRFWQTAADERVCPVCRSIPLMNVEGIGIDDVYATVDGESSGPPEHGDCRCTERFEIDPDVNQQSSPTSYSDVRIIS
jgi:hypothetical protein